MKFVIGKYAPHFGKAMETYSAEGNTPGQSVININIAPSIAPPEINVTKDNTPGNNT